jgi:hypothetical protein
MSPLLRRRLVLGALAAMLIPIAVSSNSPPLQWFLYRVHGHLSAPGSLDQYAVVLFARDTQWHPVSACHGEGAERYGPLVDMVLTDKNGYFKLNIASCGFERSGYDTLAVAVVLPDTTYMGTPFRLDAVPPKVIQAHTENDYGCDGYDYVEGYVYEFPARNIALPAGIARK